jgi:hypothetical protein
MAAAASSSTEASSSDDHHSHNNTSTTTAIPATPEDIHAATVVPAPVVFSQPHLMPQDAKTVDPRLLTALTPEVVRCWL